MRIIGSASLHITELPTQLQFVNGYQSGWVDFMAPPAALFIIFLWTIVYQYFLISWFVVIAYFLLVLWWLNSNKTKLYVTDTLMVARGSLGRSYLNERRVRTEELKSFVYLTTSSGVDIAGLYAIHGWTRTCLMPRLSEAEANSIIDTIHKKFPFLEQGYISRMTDAHAEANGEFRPHLQHVEVDHLEDMRRWKENGISAVESEVIQKQYGQKAPSGIKDLKSK